MFLWSHNKINGSYYYAYNQRINNRQLLKALNIPWLNPLCPDIFSLRSAMECRNRCEIRLKIPRFWEGWVSRVCLVGRMSAHL